MTAVLSRIFACLDKVVAIAYGDRSFFQFLFVVNDFDVGPANFRFVVSVFQAPWLVSAKKNVCLKCEHAGGHSIRVKKRSF